MELVPGHSFSSCTSLVLAHSHSVFRFSIGETAKPCILLSYDLCHSRTDPNLLRQSSIISQSFFLAAKHQSRSGGRGIFTGGGAFLVLHFGGHLRWHGTASFPRSFLFLIPVDLLSSCHPAARSLPLPCVRRRLYHRHGSGLTLARAFAGGRARSSPPKPSRNHACNLAIEEPPLPTNERTAKDPWRIKMVLPLSDFQDWHANPPPSLSPPFRLRSYRYSVSRRA